MNLLRNVTLTAAAITVAGWMNANAGDIATGDLDKTSGWILYPNNPKQVTTDTTGEIAAKGQLALYSKKIITIDPAKKYRLSGEFRYAPGTQSNRFYFGFEPFDINRKPIQPTMVGMVSGTETELAVSCKPGDKTLKVVDASMWLTGNKYCVAFNIAPSGADLPNRTLSSTGIKSLKPAGSAYEAELDKPCGIAAAAGTKIRLHQTGSTFIYPAAEYKESPADWQEFSGIINPEIESGSPRDAWWKGTKMCRIIVLANYGKNADDAALQLKNIKLEQLEDTK